MFRRIENQFYIEEFTLPFEGKLRADNRWVKLAKIIPWESIEERYADLFPSNRGQMAKPVRMALGALIIKEKCGYSDRETVEQITENPYLQYFIGLREYQDRPPFDPSLMVHFRKRFGTEALKEINEEICLLTREAENKRKTMITNLSRPQAMIRLKQNYQNPKRTILHPGRTGQTKANSSWTPPALRRTYAIPMIFLYSTKPGRNWMRSLTQYTSPLVNLAKGRAPTAKLPVKLILASHARGKPARKRSVKPSASN